MDDQGVEDDVVAPVVEPRQQATGNGQRPRPVVQNRPPAQPVTAPHGSSPSGGSARTSTTRRILDWARTDGRVPLWSARIAGLLGLLALIDGLLPRDRHTLAVITLPFPHSARAAATAIITVSGLLLLRVATGLRRRKRIAWRLAVLTCAATVVSDVIRPYHRPASVIVTAALLVLLLLGRRQFTAHSDPRGRRFALLVLVQGVVIGLVYGLIYLWSRAHLAPQTGFWQCVREVLASMVGLGGTVHFGNDRASDVFHATLLAWGLLTLAFTIVSVLRSADQPAMLPAEDETRLRSLLAKQGARDSLGYFALRRDKSLVWSPTGKAAVSYRVVAGVALISADPLGDPEAWPGAIAEYRTRVEQNGWTAAVMGCSELGATVFARELGVSVLALGDEAILDVDQFSLGGRSMRGVRQACARVERAGYQVTVRRMGDVAVEEIAQLRAAADAWRTDPVERGFSMALSRLGDPSDADCVIVTATLDGALAGLLHFVPWGRDGISLDLMRRDRDAENGLNEYMITALVEACAGLGVREISLNFAVFRDALDRGGQIGAGPVLKAWRRVLVFASRWWQLDTLYRFNAKFQPRWEPRFICYPKARDIPRVALAALEAEAFFVRPRLLMRLIGRA